MRSVLSYTAARLAIFAMTFAVLWILGAKSWLALLLAVVISGIISYVVLSRMRDVMSSTAVSTARTARRRLAEGAAREDEDEDADS